MGFWKDINCFQQHLHWFCIIFWSASFRFAWPPESPSSEFSTSYCPKQVPADQVQKSDAGVGIGTLIGDRDYIARKYRNWFVFFAQNRFMFFDRNEIHIQAFGEI